MISRCLIALLLSVVAVGHCFDYDDSMFEKLKTSTYSGNEVKKRYMHDKIALLQKEYRRRFHTPFPFWKWRLTDEERVHILVDCLENNYLYTSSKLAEEIFEQSELRSKESEKVILALIKEYNQRFNDCFPMAMMCKTDEEYIQILQECLKNNRPCVISDEILHQLKLGNMSI